MFCTVPIQPSNRSALDNVLFGRNENKSENRLVTHGSSKPGKRSFGRFSRPLLEGVNALIIPPPDNDRGGGHYD